MGAHVVVVGAGMGGLAAAVLLAAQGVEVTLLERGVAAGGKLRQVDVGGAAVDVGPTVLTLRPVFEALFRDGGGRLDDVLTLERAEVVARHLWPDGSRLDLHADLARSAEAVGDFAGAEAAREFLAFMARARETYQILDEAFIRDPAPSLAGLMLKAGPARLSRIDPYQSYWRALEASFSDARLRQLFARYATYVGCSPFEAPATLMLIAHVEQAGVWRVREGLSRLPEALADLARAQGAHVRFGAQVDEIRVERGRATGVRLADSEVIAADAVVHDGDSGVLGAGGLGRGAARAAPVIAPDERSYSAFTLAMTAQAAGPLAYHTVAFSPDYPAEFAALKAGRIPSDASLYLCAPDRGVGDGNARDQGDRDRDRKGGPDGAPAAGGRERLFLILNAPARGDAGYPDRAESERCEAMARRNLRRCGIELNSAETVAIGPREFEGLSPGTGGALYGRAGHGWMAAFKRPGTRSRVPGLYLAGGSVHPGPGLPMAALSGRAAADCVLSDLKRLRPHPSARTARSRERGSASTSPSPTTATPGGTSTP